MTELEKALKAFTHAQKQQNAAQATLLQAQQELNAAQAAEALAKSRLEAAGASLAALPEIGGLQNNLKAAKAEAASADQALKKATSAWQACLSSKDNTDNGPQLEKDFREAVTSYSKAQAKVAVLEAELDALREERKRLEREQKRLDGDHGNAATKSADTATAHDGAASEVQAAVAETDRTLLTLTAALAAVGQQGGAALSPALLAAISGANRAQRRDFLTIPSSTDALDSMVRKTLKGFAETMEKDAPVQNARDQLVAAGVATRIAQVTNRLSRKRLSNVRKAILARSYVPLLMQRLGNPVDPAVARDTVGLADTILLDLEAPMGPLHRYADLLAAEAVKELNLDAPPNSPRRQIITAQLLGSI